MDFFVTNLDSDNNFLKWGAIHVFANLAAVDSENQFEKIFDKYFAPIPGPVLITASNVVKGAPKIAKSKPALTARVARELLKVEKARYKTDECRDIALGIASKSFEQFYDQIEDKATVIKLIKKQLNKTRNATQKKAADFLKKHSN